jgi:virulence-associated protein VagC
MKAAKLFKSGRMPRNKSWDAFVSSLERFTPGFMAARGQPRKKDKRNAK